MRLAKILLSGACVLLVPACSGEDPEGSNQGLRPFDPANPTDTGDGRGFAPVSNYERPLGMPIGQGASGSADEPPKTTGGAGGSGSVVGVLIESADAHERWGTVGVSHNVIEASWQALVDSFEYKLYKDEKQAGTSKPVKAPRPAATPGKKKVPAGKLPARS